MLSRAFLRSYMIMPESEKKQYQSKFSSGIKNVLENACILTEKPSFEQRSKMNKRLLDFKQTKPLHDRIVEALLALGLPETNANKVLDFVSQTKKVLGDDSELQKFVKELASMGFIDE